MISMLQPGLSKPALRRASSPARHSVVDAFGSCPSGDPLGSASTDPFGAPSCDPFSVAQPDPFASVAVDPFALADDDPFAATGPIRDPWCRCFRSACGRPVHCPLPAVDWRWGPCCSPTASLKSCCLTQHNAHARSLSSISRHGRQQPCFDFSAQLRLGLARSARV